MNAWLFAANAMLLVSLLALPSVLFGSGVRRIIGLQLVTLLAYIALLLFALGFQRPDFADLTLSLALLSYGGSLAFAHVLERWL